MFPANRIWNNEGPPFLAAEVAQAHDGSLGQAHAYIDAAARAGADAIKFQTHIADAESSPEEPWRVKFSPQDNSRQDYWRRMEFTPDQWAGLKAHANDAGLVFLSSPFSLEAVRLLEKLDVPAWKVASGEVANPFLMDAILATRKPVILSSGLSDWTELDATVGRVRTASVPLAILQCTTEYPCPPERTGINIMEEMSSRYGCPVGLSDHSGTIFPALAAAVKNARLIEVHVAFNRGQFGPDTASSLTFEELTELVRGLRAVDAMLRHQVDKNAIAAEKAELRRTFGQSLYAAEALTLGTELQLQHLACRKPGIGIAASERDRVTGRKTNRPLAKGEWIREEDLQ